ncbi:hypothetical protein [Novosphingobium mangrovi (ex Huang et al. 2023)]|uniref:Nickel/cobalt efflux system n=1 Tax=Novosphingobium mangrovi (ex Huang et al. 2023) TaxID=2976432 RepID=A0ABT2I1R5_9SPHN|nr:hypothetical protein [Novosphingobium mangrovi (ex Huang et al. 2023)]MCT2398750.1 hypothetical protein [Novosphingobium mangrovi (ex Huang et al. 2023)]
MIDLGLLTLPALSFTAFLLGARHGLDADHLSVVDAVARRDALERPWSARLAGFSFSLGHVLVVAAVALLACFHLDQTDMPPAWLETVGVAISATMLTVLGGINLALACRRGVPETLGIQGWRSAWVRPAERHSLIVLTGALFALSFDTMAIALGLGVAGKVMGDWRYVPIVCTAFGSGMMLVGTANGAFTVHLLRSARKRVAGMTNAMTLVIGLINLGLGLLAFAALLLPRLDQWREEYALATSAAVVLLCVVMFIGIYAFSRVRPAGEDRSPASWG